MKSITVFATGGTPNAAEKEIDAVWKNSLSEDELKTIPHFYMQAGICYEKMSVPDCLIMKAAASFLSKKDNKSAYDTGFEQAIKNSAEYNMPVKE